MFTCLFVWIDFFGGEGGGGGGGGGGGFIRSTPVGQLFSPVKRCSSGTYPHPVAPIASGVNSVNERNVGWLALTTLMSCLLVINVDSTHLTQMADYRLNQHAISGVSCWLAPFRLHQSQLWPANVSIAVDGGSCGARANGHVTINLGSFWRRGASLIGQIGSYGSRWMSSSDDSGADLGRYLRLQVALEGSADSVVTFPYKSKRYVLTVAFICQLPRWAIDQRCNESNQLADDVSDCFIDAGVVFAIRILYRVNYRLNSQRHLVDVKSNRALFLIDLHRHFFQ